MVRPRLTAHVAVCALADALTLYMNALNEGSNEHPHDSGRIADYVGDALSLLDPDDDVHQDNVTDGAAELVSDIALMSIDIDMRAGVSDDAEAAKSVTWWVAPLAAIVAVVVVVYILFRTNATSGEEPRCDRGQKDGGNTHRAGEEVSKRPSSVSSDYAFDESPSGSHLEVLQSPAVASKADSPLLLLPLCPQLMVPERSKLRCIVPEVLSSSRQDTTLTISSIPGLGGNPLFQARLTEDESLSGHECGIHLEALGGAQRLASVCTAEVWDTSNASPKLAITRVGGLQYATMQKTQRGDYVIACELGILAIFSGDYLAHDIQITNGDDQTMAQVMRNDFVGRYEVIVSPNIDAGLIILGLLAIDKNERHSPLESLYM